jgi:monofunctional biosynthetic peptidoglycan transglycosylase
VSAPSTSAKRPRRWTRFFSLVLLALLLIPPLTVATHRLVGPPMTFLMVERLAGGEGMRRAWRPLGRISPNLVYAAIAAEDANFCRHHGFDLKAIERALKNNERRPNRLRGGSTISQQTAKNVFLWSGRGWIRKGFEAGYTVLIEALWGKRRTMEIYLNGVEWGPGIYGAEAAARHWFGVSAKDLTPRQAAGLAAILPSPRKWKAASSGPYVRRRVSRIQAAMGTVRAEGLAACVLPAKVPPRRKP